MEILNHKIIDFDSVIRKKSEINIIDNFYEQGIDIESVKLNSKIYKTLFFNYYIKNIIEFLEREQSKCFFVVSKPSWSEFFEYFDSESIFHSYETNTTKLFKILPLVYHLDLSLEYENLINQREGEWVELVSASIIKQRDKIDSRSFKSVKNTINYYNLKYIDNKLFNNLKIKSIF